MEGTLPNRISRLRKNFWDLMFLGFALSVLAFGLLRVRRDLRWSCWAGGDAMALNAAIHFANEGFRNHYFLEYYHPGFLGKSVGNESPAGYYTRYPPLCAVFNGFLIRHFGDNPVLLKSVSVAIAVSGLAFGYLAFCSFFSKRVSFLSVLLIGGSVGFLQMMDAVCAYVYSEFFRFAILFFFLLWDSRKGGRTLRLLLFGTLWLLVYGECVNSLDYYFFPQIFFWLYYALTGKKAPRAALFALAAAPVAAFFTHFYLSVLALRPFCLSAADAL